MKKILRNVVGVVLLLSANLVMAQAHIVTWNAVSAPVGSTVTLGFVDYVIIRVPVRDFNGDKYVITFPAPSIPGFGLGGSLTTIHNTGAFAPDLTIDGYGAQVFLTDGFSYSISEDIFSPGTNVFTVSGTTSAGVTIRIGSMDVFLFANYDYNDPLTGTPPVTSVNIGASKNAVSAAEWWKYVDQAVPVNALDRWVDYIRVYKIP